MHDLKKQQRAWYFYDWANSAFYTTVVSLFLGPYLTVLARNAADPAGLVHPLGIPVAYQSLWSYMVSLSVFAQVFLLPVFGALADYGRRKRALLGILAGIGSAATMAMFFLDGSRYLLACGLFLIANSAFGASIVVYNSFLPEIAPPEERDQVSSKGWGLGYLGGGLLLVLNVLLYQNADKWGLGESLAVRISMFTAGLWWAFFTIFAVAGLRDKGGHREVPAGSTMIGAALRQLQSTVKEVIRLPETLKFLVAYLIYNDAIQTVIAMAAQFGKEELKLPVASLTIAILIAQFVGIAGTLIFNQVSKRIGTKPAVMITLVCFSGVLIYAYAFVNSEMQFYTMAGAVGAVMGGSQALSRSLFSYMIPEGHEAEYYSVYEISDKGTSWLGPLFFGLALQFTASYRVAIVSLILFFIVGLAILATVNVQKAMREAGNAGTV